MKKQPMVLHCSRDGPFDETVFPRNSFGPLDQVGDLGLRGPGERAEAASASARRAR